MTPLEQVLEQLNGKNKTINQLTERNDREMWHWMMIRTIKNVLVLVRVPSPKQNFGSPIKLNEWTTPLTELSKEDLKIIVEFLKKHNTPQH